MKIGIASNVNSIWGEKRYEILREVGFDCLDYQMANTKDDPLYHCSEDELKRVLSEERAMAESAGVRIWQMHGPWQWPITDGEPGGREERLEKMQRSIRAAAMLDTPYWVIHPFMPYGINDLKTGKAEQTVEANISFFTELVKTAEDVGVTICLENMPFYDFSIATPDKVFEIVKAIDHPNFKMCLDTGHAVMFKKWQPERAIREYSEHIRTLHIHDNQGRDDTHNVPFKGIVNWSEVANALHETGWEGVFSLETVPSSKTPSPVREQLYRAYAALANAIIN